jgi:hypothetical protein
MKLIRKIIKKMLNIIQPQANNQTFELDTRHCLTSIVEKRYLSGKSRPTDIKRI